MNDLVRLQDLVNNPTPRVPVCLCLDTSGSMNQIIGGDVEATGEQFYEDGKMWDIVTGGITAIEELTEGVKAFYDELRNDEVAQYSAEICIQILDLMFHLEGRDKPIATHLTNLTVLCL